MATRAVPQRELPGDLVLVPNTGTDYTTTDSWIFQIVVNNVSAATATLTVQDRATSAKLLLKVLPTDPGFPQVLVFPFGVKMNNGIRWSSDTLNALHASIFGYYAG
jgi:hypothetical protein